MNIFNDFELLDFINLDEMMWEEQGPSDTELVVASAIHTLKSPNITLVENLTLVVDNAIHALTSSNAVLSQLHNLKVDNAIHALTSST